MAALLLLDFDEWLKVLFVFAGAVAKLVAFPGLKHDSREYVGNGNYPTDKKDGRNE